jgi:hypothetical protein
MSGRQSREANVDADLGWSDDDDIVQAMRDSVMTCRLTCSWHTREHWEHTKVISLSSFLPPSTPPRVRPFLLTLDYHRHAFDARKPASIWRPNC